MTDERLTNLAMISTESETAETKIRYNWVDNKICILENMEKVIFLTWIIANVKVCLGYRLRWCSESWPESLQKEGFTFEQEWLDILEVDKNSIDSLILILSHNSIWGGLERCLWI